MILAEEVSKDSGWVSDDHCKCEVAREGDGGSCDISSGFVCLL